jgi:hypothetical protein
MHTYWGGQLMLGIACSFDRINLVERVEKLKSQTWI